MMANQDRPENFDEEIDAALKMLSETAPPEAMVSRVHRSLEAAAANIHRTRSPKLFWIPATACAIVAILFFVFTQSHQTRGKLASADEMVNMTTKVPAAEAPTATSPALTSVESAGNRASSSRAIARHSRQAYPNDRHSTKLLSYPLTRQEKLLLQFAQTAAPKDLQALNPEHQAAVEAEEKAKFAAYLNPRSVSSIKETLN